MSKSQLANIATLFFKIAGEVLTVISIKGKETLSSPFRFEINTLIDRFFDMAACINMPAHLTMIGADGTERSIAGIITVVEEGKPHNENQTKCRFILKSSVFRLTLRKDYQVILGHTVPDIARTLCERHGISNLKFDLAQNYPMCPYKVQVGETDLDFMQRILGNSGITFWSSCDPDKQNQERITFTDHNANYPYLKRNVLAFKKPTTAVQLDDKNKMWAGIFKMAVHNFQQTDNVTVHDWNENTPASNLYVNRSVNAFLPSQGFADTNTTYFGHGSKALDETERLAKMYAEYARNQSWYIEAHSNVIDMAAGQLFSLDASDFNPEHSGDVLVFMVEHEASQAAGYNLEGDEVAYNNKIRCIKRETPFRPMRPVVPEIPVIITARIESEGPYSSLNEQGRYKLRNLFDLSDTENTQASIPIRKLQPFGGPPSDSATGMHLPLHDGDEVLLSFLNGDPDRPMIVGSAYTTDKINPVTAHNKTQNIIRTKAGNELLMDDKKNHEVITLHNKNGYNILKFNADVAGHSVLLNAQRGALIQYAKKTHTTTTGGSIHENIKKDRLEIVENRHSTTSKEGAITHQAKTDISEKAHNSIKTKSGQNTEIKAGNNLVYNVADNVTFTIKGKDGFFAKIRNGELTINAAKEISITGKGGGDITVEQNGAGFKIDKTGNIFLYGNKVSLGGKGQVNLIGNVNYDIGSGTIPDAVKITPPLPVQDIIDIPTNDGEPTTQDIKIEINDAYLNQLGSHLTMLDEIKYQLLSDLGDKRTGVLNEGMLVEKQVKLKQNITLEFSEAIKPEPLDKKKVAAKKSTEAEK